jgi:hypothetical protein
MTYRSTPISDSYFYNCKFRTRESGNWKSDSTKMVLFPYGVTHPYRYININLSGPRRAVVLRGGAFHFTSNKFLFCFVLTKLFLVVKGLIIWILFILLLHFPELLFVLKKWCLSFRNPNQKWDQSWIHPWILMIRYLFQLLVRLTFLGNLYCRKSWSWSCVWSGPDQPLPWRRPFQNHWYVHHHNSPQHLEKIRNINN